MVQRRKMNPLRLPLMVRLRTEGWTYAAIGQRLGISRQAVHHALTVSPRPRPGPGARQDLARCLKVMRHRAGISQDQLAKQAGLCHLTVRRIEEGRRWPHPATFERLAKALGVTVAVLTGEESLRLSPERNGKKGKRC
jgi:transcriptional regulator with XRE-family HTH domain